jgi:4-hydroxy-tetrahydrodipicolinate synthase
MDGNHGLLVTPFDDHQDLDLRSLRDLIEFSIEGQVDGLIALGTTGEFFSLTAEEKRQVVDVTIDHVRNRVPVWIGVGYSGTRVAAELASYAAARGASGILLPPPYYYPLSDTSLSTHFSAVAEAAKIDVMLYDGGGGIEIPIDLIDSLNRKYPHISYVKASVLRPNKISALRKALGSRVKLFCGDETMLMPALASGAVGMATASGIVLPETCSSICRHYAAGRTAEARRLYTNYLAPWTVASGITKSEFVRCFKEVLAAKGIIRSPTTRLPLGGLEPSRHAELLLTAMEIGLLPVKSGIDGSDAQPQSRTQGSEQDSQRGSRAAVG